MDRLTVVSNIFVSVGYEALTSILEIEFNNGSVYQYSGMPQHIYDNLMSASSKDTYFIQHIQYGYPYSKVKKLISQAICPYCNKGLDKIPTRKKKCPVCNNYMYVRTQPSDRQKVLVTEDRAKQVDSEWAKIGFRENRLRQLTEFEITEHDFEKRVGKSIEEASEQEFNDVIWVELNKLANRYMKNNDFGALKSLYYEMALKLNEQGKDWFKVLQESHKMELYDYKNSDVVKKVEILASDDSCEACKQLDHKIFSIKEALEKMPIPCKECTYKFFTAGDEKGGFCRCTYLPVIENN